LPASRPRTKPAAERRRDIMEAAIRLFREEGYNETTVGDIAAAADVATGTLYLYFASKEQILAAVHESFHGALAEKMGEVAAELLERRANGEPVDLKVAVDRLLDITGAFMSERREACEVVMKYLAGPEIMRSEKVLVEFLTRLLEEGVRQGVVQTSDPEMAARLMSAAIGFTTGTSVAFGDPPDLNRLIAAAKEFLYKALVTPPAG
jgi:AcrR family transcriptional regulator